MFRPCHALPLALGLVLQAAPPVHFGGAGHLDFPVGPLNADLDGKVGLGASFQVSFEAGRAALVRTRLDVDHLRVSGYRRPGSNYREDTALDGVGAGVEVLGYPGGDRSSGLYGLAGAGVMQWFQTFTTSDYGNSSSSSSYDRKTNRFSPWAALGAGWQVSRVVGVELRGVLSAYDRPRTAGLTAPFQDVPSDRRHALLTQLAVTFRL
jgi:hypothetical protein